MGLRMSKEMALKVVSVLVVVTMVAGGCIRLEDGVGSKDVVEDDGPPTLPPTSGGLWTPFQVEFSDPTIEFQPYDYSLPLTAADIVNPNEFSMSDAQRNFLLANGMVGLSESGTEFKSFSAAYEYIQDRCHKPTFITSDAVLDAYHHIFEGVLIELEEGEMSDQATTMARKVMWASDAQVASLPEEGKDLARANVVFFGVALRIFDPEAKVPAYAETDIEDIIALIDAASGFEFLPGFKQEEDFTQYKPRGHYTRSDELGQYFKGMMWFGRITFQNRFDDEARRAVLASVAMKGNQEAWDAYTSMANVIDFMVGLPDDLTPQEIMTAVEEVLGVMDEDFAPLFDDDKLDELQDAIGQLRVPKISSDRVEENETILGMRVFGQRYVPDSYIFQNCVYDKVKLENRPIQDQRLMPSAIDVFAVLGSKEAMDREDLDTFAPHLENQLTDLREEFDAYPDSVWSSTLYYSWLHSLKSLHESVQEERGPAFMQTRAWSAKELNAQAASWTQLTHDTILYRKQSYTTFATSLPPPPSDIVYVEPVPILYSRLGDMVNATIDGLTSLGFESDRSYAKLRSYSGTLTMLERAAVNILEGRSPAEEDRASLKFFFNDLENLNKMGEGKEDTKTILVSDVHTDPNFEEVLQEAVGPVRLMLVVVPTEHGNYVTVGAVFEHYEFTGPMSNRLTDEEWTAMLEDGLAPEPAPWARDFNP